MDETPERTTADEHAGVPEPVDVAASERLPLLRDRRRGAVQPWRQRAGALRSTLPELARNPVVVSASTVAVTLAARLAVEVARRALTPGAGSAPGRLEVGGQLVHHVVHHHVVHHSHVVHHVAVPVVRLPLLPPPGR